MVHESYLSGVDDLQALIEEATSEAELRARLASSKRVHQDYLAKVEDLGSLVEEARREAEHRASFADLISQQSSQDLVPMGRSAGLREYDVVKRELDVRACIAWIDAKNLQLIRDNPMTPVGDESWIEACWRQGVDAAREAEREIPFDSSIVEAARSRGRFIQAPHAKPCWLSRDHDSP